MVQQGLIAYMLPLCKNSFVFAAVLHTVSFLFCACRGDYIKGSHHNCGIRLGISSSKF